MSKQKITKQTITFRPSKESKFLLAHLQELAKTDRRSLNQYIEFVLIRHVKRMYSNK